MGLRNPYDYKDRNTKEIHYWIASRFVDGPFADELRVHYIWGRGEIFNLNQNDIKNLLRPIASLTWNREFQNEVFKKASEEDCCPYKRQFALRNVFDENNPSGGLGYYSIIVDIEVIACRGTWKASGTAIISDRWDFKWTWDQLKKEISDLWGNSCKETRTFFGSFINGTPFTVTSDDSPIQQSSGDFNIRWE